MEDTSASAQTPPALPKRTLQYIIVMNTEVPDDESYAAITAEEATDAGTELPIDTTEKKCVMERWFIARGEVSVAELLEFNSHSVTVVVNPTEEVIRD